MTHAVRFVAVIAVLVAIAFGAQAQAQRPEIDELRTQAEQGDADAQFNLGLMYTTGRGVPQDDVQAHMWFNLGASRAQIRALRDLAVRGRDRAARQMNRTQIAEAHRRLNEWAAVHPREP
jgi:hypothetical protein